ncbi:uncharacterized protein LAESUDRAFT_769853 [Laetiporus sulphureus 93-53]|uniref:DRBM domain-containing protein n=1 Tax=Laetiporus sulphureus 93-53 TaxID=1314785 RepID=A0A165F588_9APHY|nr:uncharacterized protein LAESUDRAFT_769853 [Laetiporus sulphureus 93-53]KZT08416.1 hypothetical protein LAESUDRAFT_769853 [Laetiporus sulphureus 93-53]
MVPTWGILHCNCLMGPFRVRRHANALGTETKTSVRPLCPWKSSNFRIGGAPPFSNGGSKTTQKMAFGDLRLADITVRTYGRSNMPDFRMDLNNWLQANSIPSALTWKISSRGPKHAPTWIAVAYIDEIEYGAGSRATKGAAMEVAAEQTLRALKRKASGR